MDENVCLIFMLSICIKEFKCFFNIATLKHLSCDPQRNEVGHMFFLMLSKFGNSCDACSKVVVVKILMSLFLSPCMRGREGSDQKWFAIGFF